MIVRTSEALWEGNIKKGKGTVKVGSSNIGGSYSFGSRFGHEPGTNPEELIGAAHAGCFHMALAMMLEQSGYSVDHHHTIAKVRIDKVGEDIQSRISNLILKAKCRVVIRIHSWRNRNWQRRNVLFPWHRQELKLLFDPGLLKQRRDPVGKPSSNVNAPR